MIRRDEVILVRAHGIMNERKGDSIDGQGAVRFEAVAASVAGGGGGEVYGGGVLFARFVPWAEAVGEARGCGEG